MEHDNKNIFDIIEYHLSLKYNPDTDTLKKMFKNNSFTYYDIELLNNQISQIMIWMVPKQRSITERMWKHIIKEFKNKRGSDKQLSESLDIMTYQDFVDFVVLMNNLQVWYHDTKIEFMLNNVFDITEYCIKFRNNYELGWKYCTQSITHETGCDMLDKIVSIFKLLNECGIQDVKNDEILLNIKKISMSGMDKFEQFAQNIKDERREFISILNIITKVYAKKNRSHNEIIDVFNNYLDGEKKVSFDCIKDVVTRCLRDEDGEDVNNFIEKMSKYLNGEDIDETQLREYSKDYLAIIKNCDIDKKLPQYCVDKGGILDVSDKLSSSSSSSSSSSISNGYTNFQIAMGIIVIILFIITVVLFVIYIIGVIIALIIIRNHNRNGSIRKVNSLKSIIFVIDYTFNKEKYLND